MKETVEHNNRFYGEELKTENEQLKEWLIVANKETERLNNIINELEKSLKNLKGYYDQISFNTKAEFDDEEQVNRFWQEYGESKVVDYYFDKLQELKGVDKD